MSSAPKRPHLRSLAAVPLPLPVASLSLALPVAALALPVAALPRAVGAVARNWLCSSLFPLLLLSYPL